MGKIVYRFKLSLNEVADRGLDLITQNSSFNTKAKVVIGALAVLHDLVCARLRGYDVLLKHRENGSVWLYSPDNPGTAQQLSGSVRENPVRERFDNVIVVDFKRDENDSKST